MAAGKLRPGSAFPGQGFVWPEEIGKV